MHRHIRFILASILILFAQSCKKDLLHWQRVQQLNSNTNSTLNNVRFISDKICIAAGGDKFDRSVVLRSDDGGYTWSANSYTSAPKEMYGMGISPNGTIYLSGIDGDVLHSVDSGRTWQFNRINTWLTYTGGFFATPDTGIFVSSVLQRQSSITRVDAKFNVIDEKTFLFGLNNIYMTSPNTGYIIGYGTVMKTTDQSNTWSFLDVKGDNFTAMDIHGNEIWMCGAAGGVYHTTDAGNSWDVLRDGNNVAIPKYYLRCIVFKDSRNGWAAGDKGKVIYTKDGGKHWSEYDKFTENSLRSIAICPNGDLLVAGDNGSLFRMTTP